MDLIFWIAAAAGAVGLAAGYAAAALFRRATQPDRTAETQDDFTASVARWGHLKRPPGDR